MVRTFVTGAALHIQHWSRGRNFAAVLWLIRCGARKPPRSPDHAPLPSSVWRDPNGAFVCLAAVARVLDFKPIRARPRPVGSIPALAHDALKVEAAGVLENGVAVTFDLLREV